VREVQLGDAPGSLEADKEAFPQAPSRIQEVRFSWQENRRRVRERSALRQQAVQNSHPIQTRHWQL